MYPYVFEISINTLSAYKIEAKEICSKDAKTWSWNWADPSKQTQQSFFHI